MNYKTPQEELAEFHATKLFVGITAGSADAIAYQLEGNPMPKGISNDAIAKWLRSLAKKLYAINHGEPMEIITQVKPAPKPLTEHQIDAKKMVDAWTTPENDLLIRDDEVEVVYDHGSHTAMLNGFFDADLLIEIAYHMKMTQL